MSWLFSRALVEEFSEAICSDGEPFVRSSGSPIPQAYCAPDKMKAFSRVSRFGMTFGPLTEDRGEELLTWFRAGFPVKTFPQPEKVQESTESEAECGPKWRGSFARFDPDSYSWRTHQCSLLGGLTEYSETWPRWGSMRSGECWERPMLAHRTRETESGSWPTPIAIDGPYCIASKQAAMKEFVRAKGNVRLSGAVILWPTPTASVGGPQMMGDKLRPSGHKGSNNLAGAVQTYPTPCSRDWKDTGPNVNYQKIAEKGRLSGVVQVNNQDQTGGSLNPTWVEWLMGWPLGWTDLKPLETDKFQKWLDEHSES